MSTELRPLPGGSPPSIVLHGEPHWDSPYVFTAFVALTEKRVPFEMRLVDLEKGQQKDATYRSASLTGRVPALEHDGFWLSESQAIVEYLEDLFPTPPLLPLDPQERARARQILAWIRSDLMPLREERSTVTMFWQPPARAPSPPLGPAARAAADKLLDVANTLIRDDATQLFSGWSIADSDLAFMLHRLLLGGEHVPAKVRRFAETQWQRASVRAYVERDRPAKPPSIG